MKAPKRVAKNDKTVKTAQKSETKMMKSANNAYDNDVDDDCSHPKMN